MPRRALPAVLVTLAALAGPGGCGDPPAQGGAAPKRGSTPTATTPPTASPAITPPPAAPALPAARATKSGRFFAVELHADLGSGTPRDAARAAADLLGAAELAGDRFAEIVGETPGRLALAFAAERGGPVTIHVWPDGPTAAAAATTTSVGGRPGAPDTHVANSHDTTGSVRTPAPRVLHVALTPALPPMAFDEVGLPAQTVRAIARAAAAALRDRRFSDAPPPPAWFVEGLAAHVAGRVVGDVAAAAEARVAKPGNVARAPELDPWDAADALLLAKLSADGRRPSVADVVAGRTSALADEPRAALHAALFRTLLDGAAPPWPDGAPSDLPRLADPDVAQVLDRALEKGIAAQRPRWDAPSRTLSGLTGGRDWLQIGNRDAADSAPAVAWRVGDDSDASLAVSGRVTMLLGSRSGSVARVLFGRRPDGCYAVEFAAGTLALVRCDARAVTTATLAAVDREILRPGGTIQFEVVVIQGRVAVFVDRKELLTKDVDPASVAGTWGLGLTNGSAAAWRGLSAGR